MRDTMREIKGGSREVRGTVAAAGNIVDGVGFLVTNPGAGHYVVTFSPPFDSPPDVDVSSIGAGTGFGTNPIPVSDLPTSGGFQVTTYATDTRVVANQGFSFVAKERAR